MQTTHHQVPNLLIQKYSLNIMSYVIFRKWAYRSSPGWTQCRPRSSQYHLSAMQEPYSNWGWCSTFGYSLGAGYFTLHVWMYLLCLHSVLHNARCQPYMSKMWSIYWTIQILKEIKIDCWNYWNFCALALYVCICIRPNESGVTYEWRKIFTYHQTLNFWMYAGELKKQ